MRRFAFVSAAIVLVGAGTPAAAQAIGDRVTCVGSPFSCSAASATVGSAVEFTYGPSVAVPFIRADFSSNVLNITPASGRIQFGANQSVSFRDTTNAFTSATLVLAQNTTFIASDLVFSNGLVTLNLGGRTIESNGLISIALTTFAAAVPEPATWAMMILGFGLVGEGLRRRRTAPGVRFA